MTPTTIKRFAEDALEPFPGASFRVVRQSNHVVLDFTWNGHTVRRAITNTPSDHRSRLNDRAQIRRALRSLA